jgi:hypothetical protein
VALLTGQPDTLAYERPWGRRGILTSAAEGLAAGKLDDDQNPALKLALRIAAASLKEKPTQIPDRLPLDEAIRLTLDRLKASGITPASTAASYDI